MNLESPSIDDAARSLNCYTSVDRIDGGFLRSVAEIVQRDPRGIEMARSHLLRLIRNDWKKSVMLRIDTWLS